MPPPAAKDEKPDEHGITESSLDFSWERDVELSVSTSLVYLRPGLMETFQVTKINWKDADKALTKLYPREAGDSEDDIPAEPGSFFNFFECKTDPSDVSGKHEMDLRASLMVGTGWPGNSKRNFPGGNRVLFGQHQ